MEVCRETVFCALPEAVSPVETGLAAPAACVVRPWLNLRESYVIEVSAVLALYGSEAIMEQRLSNPAPVGFFALGVALVMTGLTYADLFEFGNLPVAVTAIVGGGLLLLAGLLEFRSGDTFRLTAFTMLGSFWLSLAYVWTVGLIQPDLAPEAGYLGTYFTMWAVITSVLFIGSRQRSIAMQAVFALVTVWFGILAVGLFVDNATVMQTGGFVGLFAGVASVYLGSAMLVNESIDRKLLPIGEPYISTIIIPDDISRLFE